VAGKKLAVLDRRARVLHVGLDQRSRRGGMRLSPVLVLGAMGALLLGTPDRTFSAHPPTAARAHASCDADDLCDLEGFTVVECTNVNGDFDGADVGKAVTLANGMIFTFETVSVEVDIDPAAVLLARRVTYQGRQVTVYKLLIDDEVYDVMRVR